MSDVLAIVEGITVSNIFPLDNPIFAYPPGRSASASETYASNVLPSPADVKKCEFAYANKSSLA